MNLEIIITDIAIDALYKIIVYNFKSSNYFYNNKHKLSLEEIVYTKELLGIKSDEITNLLTQRASALYNIWYHNRKKDSCVYVNNLNYYYYVNELDNDTKEIVICYILKSIQKTNKRHRRILHNVEEYRNGRAFCFEMLILAGILQKDDVQKYEILN